MSEKLGTCDTDDDRRKVGIHQGLHIKNVHCVNWREQPAPTVRMGKAYTRPTVTLPIEQPAQGEPRCPKCGAKMMKDASGTAWECPNINIGCGCKACELVDDIERSLPPLNAGPVEGMSAEQFFGLFTGKPYDGHTRDLNPFAFAEAYAALKTRHLQEQLDDADAENGRVAAELGELRKELRANSQHSTSTDSG